MVPQRFCLYLYRQSFEFQLILVNLSRISIVPTHLGLELKKMAAQLQFKITSSSLGQLVLQLSSLFCLRIMFFCCCCYCFVSFCFEFLESQELEPLTYSSFLYVTGKLCTLKLVHFIFTGQINQALPFALFFMCLTKMMKSIRQGLLKPPQSLSVTGAVPLQGMLGIVCKNFFFKQRRFELLNFVKSFLLILARTGLGTFNIPYPFNTVKKLNDLKLFSDSGKSSLSFWDLKSTVGDKMLFGAPFQQDVLLKHTTYNIPSHAS